MKLMQKVKAFQTKLPDFRHTFQQRIVDSAPYWDTYHTAREYMLELHDLFALITSGTDHLLKFDRIVEFNSQYAIALPILDHYPLELRDFNAVQSRLPLYFVALSFDSAYDLATYVVFDTVFGETSCFDYMYHDERHCNTKLVNQEKALEKVCERSKYSAEQVLATWANNGAFLVREIDALAVSMNPAVAYHAHALFFDLHHEDRWCNIEESLVLEPDVLLQDLTIQQWVQEINCGRRAEKLHIAFLKGIFGDQACDSVPNLPEEVGLLLANVALPESMHQAERALLHLIGRLPKLITIQNHAEYCDFWGSAHYNAKAINDVASHIATGSHAPAFQYVPLLSKWKDILTLMQTAAAGKE